MASAEPQPVELPPPLDEPREVPTPGMTTVEEVSGALGVPAGALIKALPVVVERTRHGHRARPRRPPPERDQAPKRARRRLPAGATPRRSRPSSDRPGSSARSGTDLPVIKDAAIAGDGYVCRRQQAPTPTCSASSPGATSSSRSSTCARSRPATLAPGGGTIEIEPAIEVGNIFKLGTRYSEPLGATYLDEDGTEQPIVMGSYGIGPARIVAAAIEQRADERGIVWPPPIAPWEVHLVALGKAGDEAREAADRLYEELASAGLDGPLRRPRRRGRGEADRRRAARLPAADRRRPPRARRRRRRGARCADSGADAPAAPVAEAARARAVELLDGLE